MNVYEINIALLERSLGLKNIPELFLVMAKHQVLGLESQQIADTLGCDLQDVTEAEMDETYKAVKGFVSQVYASQSATQTSGWDAIETIAIEGLLKRLPMEKDNEFLLKVAAVANRATRKHQQPSTVLDPGLRAGRTTITLTQRLVSKINHRGEMQEERTRQLSIQDGSMSNPTFAEIDSLLTVRNSPVLPHATEIRTHTAEPSEQELLDDLLKRG